MQLGGYISGSIDLAYSVINTLKLDKKKSGTKVTDLEHAISGLKDSFRKKDTVYKNDYNSMKTRAEAAEKETAELKIQFEGFQDKVQQDKDAIIAEFKNLKEYDDAIANAGGPKIQRC